MGGARVTVSPTLAINEAVKARRALGHDVLHLGFGEAGVPVHPLLRETLAAGSSDASYGDVGGSRALRVAVAHYYARRGLPTEEWQIIVGPGSKALLFALLLALEGDIVLPQPSWVSYAPQAALAHKQVAWVPIPAEAGGMPSADLIEPTLARLRASGGRPGVLLLTQPDNPTGTFAQPETVEQVLQVARAHGLTVICDEIYADLAHPGHPFTSAARLDDESCVITGGLSKSHALGGWRIGVVRVSGTGSGRALAERLRAIASEVWSCIPGPMEAVARVAYDEPSELVDHVTVSCRLHAQVSQAIYDALDPAAVMCRAPTAGFYLYVDLEERRDSFKERGVATGAELAHWLLDQHGIATLPGEAFGDDPSALRLRLATSMLYGATEAERWDALHAAQGDAVPQMPTVIEAATRLSSALS